MTQKNTRQYFSNGQEYSRRDYENSDFIFNEELPSISPICSNPQKLLFDENENIVENKEQEVAQGQNNIPPRQNTEIHNSTQKNQRRKHNKDLQQTTGSKKETVIRQLDRTKTTYQQWTLHRKKWKIQNTGNMAVAFFLQFLQKTSIDLNYMARTFKIKMFEYFNNYIPKRASKLLDKPQLREELENKISAFKKMIEDVTNSICHGGSLSDYIGSLQLNGRVLYQQTGNHRDDIERQLDLMRKIEDSFSDRLDLPISDIDGGQIPTVKVEKTQYRGVSNDNFTQEIDIDFFLN